VPEWGSSLATRSDNSSQSRSKDFTVISVVGHYHRTSECPVRDCQTGPPRTQDQQLVDARENRSTQRFTARMRPPDTHAKVLPSAASDGRLAFDDSFTGPSHCPRDSTYERNTDLPGRFCV
jgi:hypothetical protein